MEIQIHTLTPLWTGGVNGTCDRLHETGIIGSLRWWYEAIVRGLGGYACDPSQHACIYDEKKPNNGLCDACQVFGSTGWRRRFRVEVVEDHTKPAWEPADKMLNIRPLGRSRGWYLPPGRMGTFTLLFNGEQEPIWRLASLFLFLEKWGNLCPKPQLGYGVFAIVNRDDIKEHALKWRWEKMNGGSSDNDLPNLQCFGFVRYRFQPTSATWWTRVPGMERVATQVQPLVVHHQTAPVAPALKNEWRFNRWQGRREDEIEVFGALRPKRIRSKVAVSWAYPQGDGWEVRAWSWLQKPQMASNVWDILRDEPTWRRVIGVSGKLITESETKWQEWDIDECIRMLEEAKND